MQSAEYWIKKLDLMKHPEGGWFRETYRSAELVKAIHLPERFGHDHAFSTAIYYLLEGSDFSAFHRIRSDEMWHFYAGSPLNIYVLAETGRLDLLQLGPSPENGEQFQQLVKAGDWFAARLEDKNSFALVGCTVAPGFDFADFELAERRQLAGAFPRHQEIISQLTRP